MRLFPLLTFSAVLLTAARADDRITVAPAAVNGQPVHAILDTGAGFATVIVHSVADRLQLPLIPVPDPKLRATFPLCTTAVPIRLFGTEQRGQMLVLDEAGPAKPDFEMLVGWPALRTATLRLQLGDRLIAIDAEPPKDLASWQRWALCDAYGALVLEAPGADGKPFRVLVDTGASSWLSLAPSAWKTWASQHPDRPRTLAAFVTPKLPGVTVVEVSEADHLAVGPLSLGQIQLQEAPDLVANLGEGVVASLGYYALSAVDLYVDGRKNEAYTRPHRGPRLRPVYNRLGAVFVPGQDGLLAAHVLPGSPAERAGVREGDLLLRAGDIDATQWRTLGPDRKPSRLWEGPAGTPVPLTLRREGAVVTVTPLLAELLPGPADRGN